MLKQLAPSRDELAVRPSQRSNQSAHSSAVPLDLDDLCWVLTRALENMRWLRSFLPGWAFHGIRLSAALITWLYGTKPAYQGMWRNWQNLRHTQQRLAQITQPSRVYWTFAAQVCWREYWLDLLANAAMFFGTGLMGLGLVHLPFAPTWWPKVIGLGPAFIVLYSLVELIKMALWLTKLRAGLAANARSIRPLATTMAFAQRRQWLRRLAGWHSLYGVFSLAMGLGIVINAAGYLVVGLSLLLLGVLFTNLIKIGCIQPLSPHCDRVAELLATVTTPQDRQTLHQLWAELQMICTELQPQRRAHRLVGRRQPIAKPQKIDHYVSLLHRYAAFLHRLDILSLPTANALQANAQAQHAWQILAKTTYTLAEADWRLQQTEV